MSSSAAAIASLPGSLEERAVGLSDRVAFLPTERSFPASHGLIVSEGDGLALVDAGLDEEALQALAPRLSRLLVTHFHLDHVAGIGALEGVPLTWNAAETPAIQPGLDPLLDFLEVPDDRRGRVQGFVGSVYPDVPEPDATFQPGESLDLAGVPVDTIPVPGHSPGHVALAFPEDEVVFTVDVEFRGRGPWYGWPHCDPTAFEQAAEELGPTLAEADVVATSHSPPIRDTDEALDELGTFVDHFDARDQALLEAVRAGGPVSTGELVDEVRLFYGDHLDARDHLRLFCRVMTELHLERLRADGQVRRGGEGWTST